MWNGHYNLDRSYDVNGLNQYTQAGPRSIQHDANGNLTGDGIWSYGYDDQNRLISASGPGTIASYAYDGMGRQRAKTVNASTLRYLYDGDALIAEFDNTSSTPLRRYVHGPGVDDPIVEYAGSGTASKQWLYKDHQGSIIAQAGTSGTATNTYAYSPWGEVDDDLGSIFRYTGQRYDAETNLYYYKARYYSPTLGRFLQTDPIGYADQQNLYAYVHNDPVNNADPTGECTAEYQGTVGFISHYKSKGCYNADQAILNFLQGLDRAINRRIPKIIDTHLANESTENETDNGDQGDGEYAGDTPDDKPEDFENLGPKKGHKSKPMRKKSDGSIWEKDVDGHGESGWKRWPNKRKWENRQGRESVRKNGTTVKGPGDG